MPFPAPPAEMFIFTYGCIRVNSPAHLTAKGYMAKAPEMEIVPTSSPSLAALRFFEHDVTDAAKATTSIDNTILWGIRLIQTVLFSMFFQWSIPTGPEQFSNNVPPVLWFLDCSCTCSSYSLFLFLYTVL